MSELWRISERPFTEAEERMWRHLTVEANQVVRVDYYNVASCYKDGTIETMSHCFDTTMSGPRPWGGHEKCRIFKMVIEDE